MYVSSGSLEDVLKWFRDSTFRFLLLFAAGGQKSSTFLGSLFDEKETIDLISSEQIAVFLFCTNPKLAIQLEAQEGHAVFIPGERLAEPPSAPSSWWHPRPTQTHAVAITEIWDAEIRKQVVASSITFTHQLTKYFDIPPTDIPALVLLNKWSPEPIVVSTRDVADVKAVLNFLRDIRKIKIPSAKLPTTKQSGVRRRLREAKHHLELSGRHLDSALSALIEHLASSELTNEILSSALTRDNADDIWTVCGSNGADEMPRSLRSSHELLQTAVGREDVRKLCIIAKKRGDLYQSHIRTVQSLEKRVKHYERLVEDAEQRLREVPLVEAEIDDLSSKYRRKFQLKHAAAQVATVIKSIVGLAKGAKDIADAKSQILKLLGD